MVKDYTIIAVTMKNLVEDGWQFEVCEDRIVKATMMKSEYSDEILECHRFLTEKEFKDWILKEKCMYY